MSRVSDLFQGCQDERDVLRREQALGHQREACASVLFHLIITLINLHRGNLRGGVRAGRETKRMTDRMRKSERERGAEKVGRQRRGSVVSK